MNSALNIGASMKRGVLALYCYHSDGPAVMADATLKFVANSGFDLATVTLAAEEDDIELIFSAGELDAIIASLIAARAKLHPPPSKSNALETRHATVEAQFFVPAKRVAGKRIIMFRRPGIGWLPFELTGDAGSLLSASVTSALRADG